MTPEQKDDLIRKTRIMPFEGCRDSIELSNNTLHEIVSQLNLYCIDINQGPLRRAAVIKALGSSLEAVVLGWRGAMPPRSVMT